MRATQQAERQPRAASEERRASRLGRFSLALAMAAFAVAAIPGGPSGERTDAGLFSTLANQMNTVVEDGTRFVSDLHILYQMAQLRNTAAAASTSPVPRDVEPADILNCSGKPEEPRETEVPRQPVIKKIKSRDGLALSYRTVSLARVDLRIHPSPNKESGL